jgi:hypothetical protein
MQFDTVFERTDMGVAEIHQKSNRLTQSERLVLIMTDGRTDIATLVEKLPSLSMPRVFRAMSKLQDLGLMTQQLVVPVGSGNANDAIAPEVVERFLEQTDLDPATIMRPAGEDFSPTTLAPGASLRELTAPKRDDSDLERRLKALMGEPPKFARPDAPAPVVTSAPVPAAVPAPAPAVVAALTEVTAEEVVRAARSPLPPPPVVAVRQDVVTAPRRSESARARGPNSQFDVSLPRHSSTRSQRVPVPPHKRANWPLYAVMAVGAALVAFAVLRIALK